MGVTSPCSRAEGVAQETWGVPEGAWWDPWVGGFLGIDVAGLSSACFVRRVLSRWTQCDFGKQETEVAWVWPQQLQRRDMGSSLQKTPPEAPWAQPAAQIQVPRRPAASTPEKPRDLLALYVRGHLSEHSSHAQAAGLFPAVLAAAGPAPGPSVGCGADHVHHGQPGCLCFPRRGLALPGPSAGYPRANQGWRGRAQLRGQSTSSLDVRASEEAWFEPGGPKSAQQRTQLWQWKPKPWNSLDSPRWPAGLIVRHKPGVVIGKELEKWTQNGEIWVSLRTQIMEFKIHARQCMHFEYLGKTKLVY